MYYYGFLFALNAAVFTLSASSAGLEYVDLHRTVVPAGIVTLAALLLGRYWPADLLPPLAMYLGYLLINGLLFALLSKLFFSCDWKAAWGIGAAGMLLHGLLLWVGSCMRG